MKELIGLELMGENLRDKVKIWGESVRCYPLSKMIHPENAELDNHSEIFDFVFVDAGRAFKLGKYSTLTWNVLVEGGEGTFIGDRVFIGPGSKLLNSTSQLQGYYTVTHVPAGCRKIIRGDIIIENDAYIGANSVIMPGVRIREGAVVGANSFVKSDLEAWTIYAGTPCRKIGERKQPSNEIRELCNQIDWSNPIVDFGLISTECREELNI